MVRFVIFTHLMLANGMRRSTPRRTSTGAAAGNTWHNYYDTTVPSILDYDPIPATVREFAGSSSAIHPDSTIVLAVLFAAKRGTDPFLLDVASMVPYPGDPNAADYEDNIPDLGGAHVVLAGIVTAQHQTGFDGRSRAFTLDVNEYVRDARQTSFVHVYFEHDNNRWLNTQLPRVSAYVTVTGLIAGVTEEGHPIVRCSSISYIPTNAPATPSNDGESPSKKRRLVAVMKTPTPSPSASRTRTSNQPVASSSSSTIASSSTPQSSHVTASASDDFNTFDHDVLPDVLPVTSRGIVIRDNVSPPPPSSSSIPGMLPVTQISIPVSPPSPLEYESLEQPGEGLLATQEESNTTGQTARKSSRNAKGKGRAT